MNIKNKILIAMVLIICSTGRIASAESIDGDMSIGEGGKVYVQSKEEAQLEAMKMRSIETENITNNSLMTVLYNPSIIYKLGVTVFKQETGYWCGPASVRETVYYINGSAKSQTNIAACLELRAMEQI